MALGAALYIMKDIPTVKFRFSSAIAIVLLVAGTAAAARCVAAALP